jgi:hypothetical protein
MLNNQPLTTHFGVVGDSGGVPGLGVLGEVGSLVPVPPAPVPPGVPAPPVADPGCMPKCEKILCRQSDCDTSGQLFRSKDGALSSLLLSPVKTKLIDCPPEVGLVVPGVAPMEEDRKNDHGTGINFSPPAPALVPGVALGVPGVAPGAPGVVLVAPAPAPLEL